MSIAEKNHQWPQAWVVSCQKSMLEQNEYHTHPHALRLLDKRKKRERGGGECVADKGIESKDGGDQKKLNVMEQDTL